LTQINKTHSKYTYKIEIEIESSAKSKLKNNLYNLIRNPKVNWRRR